MIQVPEDAPLWMQRKIKARLDQVDLLKKISEEVPGDSKVLPFWERRLETAKAAQ